MIVVGDFFQVAHVRDSYVFKDDSRGYGPLATNLWIKDMQIYTLTEIMCQRGEKLFCEVLNRLKTDDLTEEDNTVFESRIVKKTDSHYLPEARHFFPLKQQ